MALDEARLEAFVHRFVADLGAALHASTVVIGDELGLYRALADLGPTDAIAVASATGCDGRLVQEWLDAQYVSGYCHFSARTASYWLSPEQAAVLAQPGSTAFLVGAMRLATSTAKDEEKVRIAFRSGNGLGWEEHHHDAAHGLERLSRPGYAAELVSQWIPALGDVAERLTRGAVVADVGCGHGAASILLARAFPSVTVAGFDHHRASIDVARKRAAEAGVADRVRFDVATALDFPGANYELVCVLDALHDVGDPPAAARHIRDALRDDGTWLLVEPMAGDSVDDNVNSVGRILYATSTCICTPGAQAQPGGHALGNQVPEATLAAIAIAAGFSRFRRVAASPFSRVFEVRP
jgi:2-polyprenyl-3-methyl-5-hydroxy-6-metoxy-1,4-benzoquinol methylase